VIENWGLSSGEFIELDKFIENALRSRGGDPRRALCATEQ
jgi:hypothetical protein